MSMGKRISVQNVYTSKKKIRHVKKNIVFGMKGIGIALVLFVTLFPFYWLLIMSLRPMEEMNERISLIPNSITLNHFIELFSAKGFDVAIKNSVINASLALLLSLVFGLTTAYILARNRFHYKLKKTLTGWVLLIRVLPPVAFVIPLYILFTNLGLMETRVPIVLSCMLINIPLIVWFMISFFRDLPEAVEESAKIDGASEWQLFAKVVLPLVLPGVAAAAMLSFMYAWNEYTYSVIFTRSPANYTIPLALSVLNTEDNVTNFGLVSAGGVCSFLPVALFVVFAQNYLISGLSSGAVKE